MAESLLTKKKINVKKKHEKSKPTHTQQKIKLAFNFIYYNWITVKL